MNTKIGYLIKEIRLSKSMSQVDVADGVMHQTNYSKFELGKIEISYQKLHEILLNMDMDIAEFNYLYYHDNESQKEKIIREFNSLTFIDNKKINGIIQEIKNYLSVQNDVLLKDILSVSKALLAIQNEDYNEASKYGNLVWGRLEKLDSWYLSDIKLINNILFAFPIETAQHIAEFALKQGEKYIPYSKYENVFLPIKFNLVQLLLRRKMTKKAEIINDEMLNTFIEKNYYIQISICLLRKSMIRLHHKDIEYAEELKREAYEISKVMKNQSLRNKLLSEEKSIRTMLVN
ncbi:helix-turn-helix domain-containing protein [Salisediminibacterium beveridgei]|uniref:Transcriptional regulator, MutR family n=1 Tax=Salisediminibacterium beveridgei TaxID=632773 RepID=A0A1D7QY01_9BACI|nr:helix-turn-helix transcriptional regulator [Salisediminibacterium beveridgei]AOM83883.1 Transcriptional regulator, MutR family [Salisediminibacterium beveridgei]